MMCFILHPVFRIGKKRSHCNPDPPPPLTAEAAHIFFFQMQCSNFFFLFVQNAYMFKYQHTSLFSLVA